MVCLGGILGGWWEKKKEGKRRGEGKGTEVGRERERERDLTGNHPYPPNALLAPNAILCADFEVSIAYLFAVGSSVAKLVPGLEQNGPLAPNTCLMTQSQ